MALRNHAAAAAVLARRRNYTLSMDWMHSNPDSADEGKSVDLPQPGSTAAQDTYPSLSPPCAKPGSDPADAERAHLPGIVTSRAAVKSRIKLIMREGRCLRCQKPESSVLMYRLLR